MGGEYDEWSDYHFVWTQWKSKKVLDSIKSWKDTQSEFKEES